MVGPKAGRTQQAVNGMFAIVGIGVSEREIDQMVRVLRIEPDRLLPGRQRIPHPIDHAIESAEIGVPGCHAWPRRHRAFQQCDAALRVIGVGGDHAQQGEGWGIVRRCGENVVADAGCLAEAPGLGRRLGAGQCLVGRFDRCGAAHAMEGILRRRRPKRPTQPGTGLVHRFAGLVHQTDPKEEAVVHA